MRDKKTLISPRWEYRLSILLFIGFLAVTIFYLIDLVEGITGRRTIASLIIYLFSAVIWLVKAIQDRKKLRYKKSE